MNSLPRNRLEGMMSRILAGFYACRYDSDFEIHIWVQMLGSDISAFFGSS